MHVFDNLEIEQDMVIIERSEQDREGHEKNRAALQLSRNNVIKY